jgi:hypothetical protein
MYLIERHYYYLLGWMYVFLVSSGMCEMVSLVRVHLWLLACICWSDGFNGVTLTWFILLYNLLR